ncbi:MAG: GIY-YIG nuclease family protein [Bacteroidia bacterium]|nr:GIY-YIG nuclease family protein [Bacteroidia bacterium]
MKVHEYFVYITANVIMSTNYTGVTNNITQRITEHYLNRGNAKSFAGKYHCYNLLYYEVFQYVEDAIRREKQIKGYSRKKKMELIKTVNPELKFINSEIFDVWPPKDPQLRS